MKRREKKNVREKLIIFKIAIPFTDNIVKNLIITPLQEDVKGKRRGKKVESLR